MAWERWPVTRMSLESSMPLLLHARIWCVDLGALKVGVKSELCFVLYHSSCFGLNLKL